MVTSNMREPPHGQTAANLAIVLTLLAGAAIVRLALDSSLPQAPLPDTPFHAVLYFSLALSFILAPALNVVAFALGFVGWARGGRPRLSVAAVVLNAPTLPLSCFWLFLFVRGLVAGA